MPGQGIRRAALRRRPVVKAGAALATRQDSRARVAIDRDLRIPVIRI
jgi:hypothetical protein